MTDPDEPKPVIAVFKHLTTDESREYAMWMTWSIQFQSLKPIVITGSTTAEGLSNILEELRMMLSVNAMLSPGSRDIQTADAVSRRDNKVKVDREWKNVKNPHPRGRNTHR